MTQNNRASAFVQFVFLNCLCLIHISSIYEGYWILSSYSKYTHRTHIPFAKENKQKRQQQQKQQQPIAMLHSMQHIRSGTSTISGWFQGTVAEKNRCSNQVMQRQQNLM